MTRRRQVLVGLVSIPALIGLLVIVPADLPMAKAAFAGQNGLIAFVRSAGNSEIFTMKSDGTSQTNITNNAAVDDMPVWSPDGTKIAFTSNRAGNFEIYVMNANGSNVTRLTNSPDSYDWHPAWSFDGTKIAFERDGPGEQAIYTVPATGGTATLLLDGAADPAYSPDGTRLAYLDMEADDLSGEIYVLTLTTMAKQQITWNTQADADPEWSPDGTMVAVSRFDSAGEGLINMEVWVVEANGFNETKLVGPEAMYPGWSPDQTKIAYSGSDGSNWDIYVTGSSPGGTPIRLTTATAVDADPQWQPAPAETTGDEVIAFTSLRDGNAEIYLMSPDGTAPTRLTNNAAEDDYPAISPDGTEIAFMSRRDGDAEIYVMDLDGTNIHKITDNTYEEMEPAWSPDGAALMYVSNRSGTYRLWYTLLADGMAFGPYGFAAGMNQNPDWSSVGVVFVSDEAGNQEMYRFIPDGTTTTRLTTNSVFDEQPAWSPAATQIAFIHGSASDGDLWTMLADGSSQTAITSSPSKWEFSPTWRSDASYIAFARGDLASSESLQIWTVDMEGMEHQLTNTVGDNRNPDWGPCSFDAEGTCGPIGATIEHARTLTLDLSGHLMADGRLRAPGAAPLCTVELTVKIQKKIEGDWKGVRTTTTDADGKYEQSLANRNGKYRAVAPAVTFGSDLCTRAVSEIVEYTFYL